MKLNRQKSAQNLRSYLETVRPEFEDDEACWEHRGEVEDVIAAVESLDETKAIEIAEGLGLQKSLVFE